MGSIPKIPGSIPKIVGSDTKMPGRIPKITDCQQKMMISHYKKHDSQGQFNKLCLLKSIVLVLINVYDIIYYSVSVI